MLCFENQFRNSCFLPFLSYEAASLALLQHPHSRLPFPLDCVFSSIRPPSGSGLGREGLADGSVRLQDVQVGETPRECSARQQALAHYLEACFGFTPRRRNHEVSWRYGNRGGLCITEPSYPSPCPAFQPHPHFVFRFCSLQRTATRSTIRSEMGPDA